MKIKVITGRYPSKDKPYNHMFVHTRNMEYLKYGYKIDVFVPSKKTYSYNIDGINVKCMPVNEIIKNLNNDSLVMIHLLIHSIIKELDGGVIYNHLIKNNINTLFFIHGIEVQKIYKSRPEDIEFLKPKSIARFLYRDFYLIERMRITIKEIIETTKNIKFISVSKWMQKEAENTLGLEFKDKIFIIPNGINTSLFKYQENLWKNRDKILTIRPLIFKGKYALDLAVDTMKYIKNNDLKLHIYGSGKDEKSIEKYINNNYLSEKIELFNSFINHNNISMIHKKHGIYYAVTRMDAQGVSMCEAMASGMPTVSFNTCAISEFLQDGYNGILIDAYNIKNAALKIEDLVTNKNLFLKLSENARMSIEKIDIKNTTKKELELFR